MLLGPDALEAAQRGALEDAGVVLLGARPSVEVPAYLQHADVLVVPHVVTPFTDSLDPIKLYEYQAAGRPVVSTPVAGFRDAVDELVTIADARRRSLQRSSSSPARAGASESATGAGGPTPSGWRSSTGRRRVDQMAAVLTRLRAGGSA